LYIYPSDNVYNNKSVGIISLGL